MMFGRRQSDSDAPAPSALPRPAPAPVNHVPVSQAPSPQAPSHHAPPVKATPPARPAVQPPGPTKAATEKRVQAAKAVFSRLQVALLERIDASAAAKLPREELQRQIAELIGEIVAEEKLSVTAREQQEMTITLVDDMVGFGPLEPLLADESVNDIMVNGPQQVFV
jgi:pilus assembly protein CpaF